MKRAVECLRRPNSLNRCGVTLSFVDKGASLDLYEGGRQWHANTGAAGTYRMVRGTLSCNDFPRYFEQQPLTLPGTTVWIGMGTAAASLTTYPGASGQPSVGWYLTAVDSKVYYNGSYTIVEGWNLSDVCGMGYDPQRRLFMFYRSGKLIHTTSTFSPTAPIFPLVGGSNQGYGRVFFSKKDMRCGPVSGFADWEES